MLVSKSSFNIWSKASNSSIPRLRSRSSKTLQTEACSNQDKVHILFCQILRFPLWFWGSQLLLQVWHLTFLRLFCPAFYPQTQGATLFRAQSITSIGLTQQEISTSSEISMICTRSRKTPKMKKKNSRSTSQKYLKIIHPFQSSTTTSTGTIKEQRCRTPA